MKLYHDPISTSSRSVTFFLHDATIAFEEEVVSIHAGDQHAPAFTRLNPNAQVPVLEDGTFRLTQSTAILRYLGTTHAPATYPADPRARARVDEAMDWFGTGFHLGYCAFLAYRGMLPALRAMNPATHADLERLGQDLSAKYLAVLDRHMLADGAFVCGHAVTVADYLGFSYVTLGELGAFDLSPYPRVQAWVARMKERPGYDAAYAGWRGYVGAARAAARPALTEAA
ncbi:glutathione S-transferase family protein [Roseomonas sp. CCTCC AB2023176]|uniref:glutathione S-transferase family protein n=1 Tax=Roseomonas sp. CCTCC AB2023176 TaxID=3342640 RepID=UPI0035DC23C5